MSSPLAASSRIDRSSASLQHDRSNQSDCLAAPTSATRGLFHSHARRRERQRAARPQPLRLGRAGRRRDGPFCRGEGVGADRLLGLPPFICAVLAIAALIAATGALHEDGLADIVDGFGGGRRARKLEIMRDSRLGAYGAIALTLALILRVAALSSAISLGFGRSRERDRRRRRCRAPAR